MTLVILAAGMGSRFGGLKQIEPLGPSKEFIIDYSIYDAIKAGFTKVVFIIKRGNLEIFKKTIGERVEKQIEVEYVFQENNNVDDKYKKLKERQKPLGTAHAILCCKDKVKEPFLVINSDDFYGFDAFKKAAEYLKVKNKNHGIVCYKVSNTMSLNGEVKRGIIDNKSNKLISITESKVYEKNDKLYATPLDKEEYKEIDKDSLVNMNMLALDQTIFEFLEKEFKLFLESSHENVEKCEFLIPTILSKGKTLGLYELDIIKTDSVWYGVTYKEDKDYVKESLKRLVDENKYPQNLWRK